LLVFTIPLYRFPPFRDSAPSRMIHYTPVLSHVSQICTCVAACLLILPTGTMRRAAVHRTPAPRSTLLLVAGKLHRVLYRSSPETHAIQPHRCPSDRGGSSGPRSLSTQTAIHLCPAIFPSSAARSHSAWRRIIDRTETRSRILRPRTSAIWSSAESRISSPSKMTCPVGFGRIRRRSPTRAFSAGPRAP